MAEKIRDIEETPKMEFNEKNLRKLIIETDGENLRIEKNELTGLEFQSVIFNYARMLGLVRLV